MIAIRINGKWLDMDKDTALRLQMNSPIISQELSLGEYSFPFKLKNSGTNLTALGFPVELKVEDSFKSNVDSDIYLHGNFFAKGIITAESFSPQFIDCSIQFNISNFAEVKKKLLSELSLTRPIDIAMFTQWVEYFFEDDTRGHVQIIQLMDTFFTFTPSPSLSIHATLLALKADIDATTFNGSYTLITTVTGHYIKMEATWIGLYPEIFTSLLSMGGEVRTDGYIFGVNMYNDIWDYHMKDTNTYRYPEVMHCFFPVVNKNCGIPWSISDPTGYGNMPHFVQNYFSIATSGFIALFTQNIPDTLIKSSPLTCPTPFVYVLAILDAIFNEIKATVNGFLHDNASLNIVLWSNYFIDLVKESKIAGTIFAQNYTLEETLPKITVEEFLNDLCRTMGVAPVPRFSGTAFTFVRLSSILKEAESVDWTKKYTGDFKKDAQPFTDIVELAYNFDENDEVSNESKESLAKKVFAGKFDTVGSLPTVLASLSADDYYYAFVTEENKFYIRKFISFGVLGWEEFKDSRASLKFGNELKDKVYKIEVADPILDKIEIDTLTGSNAFLKTPFVKEPISTILTNAHNAPIKARFLQFAGDQIDSENNLYPLGSTDSRDYIDTYLNGVDLRIENEKGIYNYSYKEWIDFLRNAEKIEMYFNLNIIDILNLDYAKKIYVNGSYYLINELQPEFPLRKPTQVTLLKIK